MSAVITYDWPALFLCLAASAQVKPAHGADALPQIDAMPVEFDAAVDERRDNGIPESDEQA